MSTIENSIENTVESSVQQVFVEATRYPVEVLEPTAHLEDDLGIDSVKRAEILIALQKKFGLPSDLDVPPERLTTIRDIAEVINSFIEKDPAIPFSANIRLEVPSFDVQKNELPPAAHLLHVEAVSAVTEEDIERTVLTVFAEVTRYPAEVLEPTAHLEDDLGIDSVKRAEILIALQKKFGLPPDLNVPPERLTTIRDIASVISSVVQKAPLQTTLSGEKNSSSQALPDSRSTTVTSTALPKKLAPQNGGRLISAGHKPFTGKIALVTGSGHGIGKAIATRLAALGATVVVNSFHSRTRGDETVQEIKSEGGEAIHVWGSVASPTQLHTIFDEIDSRFGHLDFFVSNASNGIIGPLKDVTEEQWKRAFQTNVIGLHQCAIRAADLMKRRKGGKIITLSSPGAHRHIQHFGCMGPIKAAVESLTLYLAVEFAGDNIQVNCVSAGPIYGELLSKYPDSDRLIPYWESLSAGNRLGEENDVTDLVTYLLSGDSNKVTGSVLLLDAGGSKRI